MNWIGPVAALAAFLGIWLGHVTVRRVEAAAPRIWVPVAAAAILGLGLEAGSLIMASNLVSAACGIVGITVLWDAVEFLRQENRVRHGHAPANPNNARHAHILAESPCATTVNMLSREPAGMPLPEGHVGGALE